MTCKFEYLIVDTGPIITGGVQPGLAEHIYTIPEVISEIKDKETKERLVSGMLSIKTREPSAEAVKIVVAAAKKTGDYSSLSKTDLKLVALLVNFELEMNKDRTDWEVQGGVKAHDKSEKDVEEVVTAKSTISMRADEESNEGGWITPQNFGRRFAEVLPTAPTEFVRLACMSGDFAVQNTVLALKMRLYNAEGRQIRHIRSFLLRCHACSWTTLNMERKFCDSCGSATLRRVAYSVDIHGVKHLHLNPNFQPNIRGTVYSLPTPKCGRQGNMVLREDQVEYQRALRRMEISKEKMERAGDDAVEERLAAVFGDMSMNNSKFNQQAGKAIIGHGRRNPNQVRRK